MTAASRGHLGDRVSALVDDELSARDRDRALVHIAACADCRAELATQRAAKALLARLGSTSAPRPAPHVVESLHGLATPGLPVPPRAGTALHGPVVPVLPPPPGRGPRGARADSRRPRGRGTSARRTGRRAGLLSAGVLSAAGLVLATAFVAGGSQSPSTGPLVPPVAELSVEHSRTTGGVTVGDPGTGLMTTFEDPAPTSTRR